MLCFHVSCLNLFFLLLIVFDPLIQNLCFLFIETPVVFFIQQEKRECQVEIWREVGRTEETPTTRRGWVRQSSWLMSPSSSLSCSSMTVPRHSQEPMEIAWQVFSAGSRFSHSERTLSWAHLLQRKFFKKAPNLNFGEHFCLFSKSPQKSQFVFPKFQDFDSDPVDVLQIKLKLVR